MVELTEFYEKYNFKVDGKTSYGVYRDRVLSITPLTNYLKATITFNEQIGREKAQNIALRIGKIKRENRVLQRGQTTSISIELYFYSSYSLQEEFKAVIDKVYDELEKCDLNKCDVCPLCGSQLPEQAPFLKIKDGVLKAHDACIDQLVEASNKFQEGLNIKDAKTSRKALLCNVITMLAIVAIIALLSLSGLYAYVSIVAGWVFSFVIKTVLFKAKVPLNSKYLKMVGMFSILTAILAVFVGSIFYVYVASEAFGFSKDINLFDVIAMYPTFFTTYYEKIGNMLIVDVILSLAFVGIGLFFDFKKAKSMESNIKKL